MWSHKTLDEIGRDTVAAIKAARKRGMPKNDKGGIATIGGVDVLDVSVDEQIGDGLRHRVTAILSGLGLN